MTRDKSRCQSAVILAVCGVLMVLILFGVAVHRAFTFGGML